ncbi:MAG: DUF192 domain-containing protein [Pseudomonadota bacterium]|jgi:uncharacterized membrane protein (UPF0127 family)|nr:DUF192 domain-containing protein [Pseudomonadota bacterium]|tara:strand:+ start:8124 stop:8558 length:435 start_codon:yes stop_codon:yes gene_type:complete
MSTLLKLLKIILISFFSFNLISSEKQNYECDLGFESIVDKNICIKNLKNNKDRKIGLMNLEKLSKFHQVNFVWNGERKIRCMWMKNTSIPLDILFVDRIKLVIEKGEPFSEKKMCHPAIKVIEANRGELLAEYKLIDSSLEYEN